MPPSKKLPSLAFLGPLGTYSHQAAFGRFGDSVEYLARPTITDVRQILSATVPFGIIPQENSTNGSVVETYSVLRAPAVGQVTFVRGTIVFEVKHSLVVRQGTKLEDIEKILSHEQALGQCREWLAKHLSRASLVHTDSTANAAQKLLSTASDSGLDPMKCAAICSSLVVAVYDGLEVLEEDIQDGPENFTRFYILSHGLDVALPEGASPPSAEGLALLRLQAPPDDSVDTDISRVISMLDMVVLRIDRRPSLHAKPFHDVYFLEVGAAPEQDDPGDSWIMQLQQAVDEVKSMGVEVTILGCW